MFILIEDLLRPITYLTMNGKNEMRRYGYRNVAVATWLSRRVEYCMHGSCDIV